jgi:hypothetical protein
MLLLKIGWAAGLGVANHSVIGFDVVIFQGRLAA